MFTGIIKELGSVHTLENLDQKNRLVINTNANLVSELSLGASVSVNGCCLTCVECSRDYFAVDVVLETFRRTSFSELRIGDKVNLELPIALNGRLDGHIVLGHVDGIGEVLSKKTLQDRSEEVTIKAHTSIMRYLIEKGSIAVDGVSLTIYAINEECFTFSMIPFTSSHTTLGLKKIGDKVNLEVDLFAKYVEKLVSGKK